MEPFKTVTSLQPAKQVHSFFEEFKKFAFKGNVIDLAVGVIIGGAFGKIVDSLVKHIIMPTVALVMPGKQSYVDWKAVINAQEIPFGLFLGEVVNFLIVALALFLFAVKFLGWLVKAQEKEVAKPVVLSKDQELLSEIRDLLRAERAPPATPSP